MFTRSRKEMEGKTATELGRYKVCNNEDIAAVFTTEYSTQQYASLSQSDFIKTCSLKQRELAATGPWQKHMFCDFPTKLSQGPQGPIYFRGSLFARKACRGKPVLVVFFGGGVGQYTYATPLMAVCLGNGTSGTSFVSLSENENERVGTLVILS